MTGELPAVSFGVKRLMARSLTPNLNNRMGSGMQRRATVPRSVPAHCGRSSKYMARAKAVNAAAVSDRTEVLMAMADVA